jgi:hypothetical protein
MTDPIPYRRLFLVLCVAWLVLNGSVLLGGRVLPWDALDQFYPTVYFNAHMIRSGIAPWWNPYIYGGYAQAGDPQGMLFSPLLMAWMLVPAQPGAGWFAWGVLLHMLMGAAAMLALLRRHGANAFGALVGALVFMGGGVAASRLEHVPIVIAYAYVPVVLLALRHFLAEPRIARGALLGLAAGAMATQLVQVTYLFVLMVVAYACIAIVRAWPAFDTAARRRMVGGLLVACMVSLVLALPQLAFTWASLQLSNRRDMALSLADAGSLDMRSLLFLVYPNAYDALRDLHGVPFDPIQAFLYVGTLPVLALAGLGRAWRARAPRALMLCSLLLALLSGLYMFGTHTPVYGWLYTWMPGLTHFRRPSDAAYLLNFALACLSAIGASTLDLRSRRDIVFVLGVATVWLTAISAVSRLAAPLFAVAVAVAAWWFVRRPRTAWAVALWLVALLVADYRSFNFNGVFNGAGDGAARFRAQAAVRYVKSVVASEGAVATQRMTTQGTTTQWDNMGVLTEIASTQGYNPLRYALYEAWYQPRENANATVSEAPYNAWPASRLDDLLGVHYLVVGHEGAGAAFTPPPDYRKLQAFKNVDVWRNDGAYPRFLNPVTVHALGVGDMPDIAAFIATDFATTLWLTPRDADDLLQSRSESGTCAGVVHMDVLHNAPSGIRIATHSTTGGWLAAGELDHPGWGADLDGHPVSIHRANGMFRAVCIPAGDHELTFRFSPWRMVAYAWRHRGDAPMAYFGSSGSTGSLSSGGSGSASRSGL